RRKIRKLHFNNRSHPLDCRAHGQTNHRVLADRCVHYPPGILLRQVLCCLERSAERTHVLPVNEHALIIRQGFRLRFSDCFKVGDAHVACPSLRCLLASAHQSSRYGSGPASRCTLATTASTFWLSSFLQALITAASAQPSFNNISSATFKQSRPS